MSCLYVQYIYINRFIYIYSLYAFSMLASLHSIIGPVKLSLTFNVQVYNNHEIFLFYKVVAFFDDLINSFFFSDQVIKS